MRRRLEVRLDELARPVAQQREAPHRVLAERMRQHLLAWPLFVAYPEVPATNNLAECSLRPAAVARKISRGTGTAKGWVTKMAPRGQRLLPACQRMLLAGSR
jgi:hypothetical protein